MSDPTNTGRNAARHLDRAIYLPLRTLSDPAATGSAHWRAFNFLALEIDDEEIGALRARIGADHPVISAVVSLLKSPTGADRMEAVARIGALRAGELDAFVEGLRVLREAALERSPEGGGAVAPGEAPATPGGPGTPGPGRVGGRLRPIPLRDRPVSPDLLREPLLRRPGEREPPIDPAEARLLRGDIAGVVDNPVRDDSAARRVHLLKVFHPTRRTLEPYGVLWLERVEIRPEGTERGELLHTLPLAPGEQVSLSHKAWTHREEEFAELVQDYLEDFSERGVAESEEIASATRTQARHSNAMSLNPTSGSRGVVVAAPMDVSGGSIESEELTEQSRTSARSLTQGAAARSVREHKVSFAVGGATSGGTAEHTGRQIKNAHADAVMHLDYHRRMRRWRTELRRIAARLAVDIVLPDPGQALRRRYEELEALDARLAQPFTASVSPGQFLPRAHQYASTLFQVPLPLPPVEEQEVTRTVSVDYPDEPHKAMQAASLMVPLPPGTQLSHVSITLDVTFWNTMGSRGQVWVATPFEDPRNFQSRPLADLLASLTVPGPDTYGGVPGRDRATDVQTLEEVVRFFAAALSEPRPAADLRARVSCGRADIALNGDDAGRLHTTFEPDLSLLASTGELNIRVETHFARAVNVTVHARVGYSDEALRAWQMECWRIVREAERARHQIELEHLRQRRAVLARTLTGQDPLQLRGLEREQIMRLVLEWLFPGFQDASKVVDRVPSPGAAATGDWMAVMEYGEFVKFVQDAVDWEGTCVFLYPYFWDAPSHHAAKLMFQHPDAAHREFLRAGAARVLLTIRPGFEEAIVSLLEIGKLGALPDGHRFHELVARVQEANRRLGAGPPDGAPGAPPPAAPPGPDAPHVWYDFTPSTGLDLVVRLEPVQSPAPSPS